MDDTGACQKERESETDVALRGSDGIPVKSHQVNSSDILWIRKSILATG